MTSKPTTESEARPPVGGRYRRHYNDGYRQAMKDAAKVIEATFTAHFSIIPEGDDTGKVLQVREHPSWYVLPDPTPFEPHGARRIKLTGEGCPACMTAKIAAELENMEPKA